MSLILTSYSSKRHEHLLQFVRCCTAISSPCKKVKHTCLVALQGHFAKAVVALLPLGLATLITCSRLVTYRHDFSDINAGIIIGLISATVAYALNYNR